MRPASRPRCLVRRAVATAGLDFYGRGRPLGQGAWCGALLPKGELRVFMRAADLKAKMPGAAPCCHSRVQNSVRQAAHLASASSKVHCVGS